MTEKQALVVMLPLTDEQWRAANAAPYAHDKGPMPGIEASIRAIGTPVDSSVPIVGFEVDHECWTEMTLDEDRASAIAAWNTRAGAVS